VILPHDTNSAPLLDDLRVDGLVHGIMQLSKLLHDGLIFKGN
jgi:hypothetical protein